VAGVKPVEFFSAGDGVKQARSPGRARSSLLKPLRGECRVIFGVTVVTMLVCFILFCTQGCGRVERPVFPAPFVFMGRTKEQNSGETCRENAESYSVVITRESG
jgi:hypothetical protein